MEFIRQNIGVVVAGVACVVLAGLLALVNVKQSGNVDAALKDREGTSRTLSSLSRPKTEGSRQVYINESLIAQQQARVDHNEQSLDAVVLQAQTFNSENFKIREATVGGVAVPAFPVDERYEDSSEFVYKLSQAYLTAVDDLLVPLQPAVAPTNEEIEARVDAERERLSYTPKYRAMQEAGESLTDIARQNVREDLRLRAAQGKRIYASPEAVGRVFAEPRPDIPFDMFWRAQISLWVMDDVLTVIKELNESVTEDITDRDVMVSDSAVRILQSINVDPNYVGEQGGKQTLTQRGSDLQHDVIHYGFTVVMPVRYVPELERRLMSRNYHTILNATMTRYIDSQTGEYDLGPEPLMQVTFQGEFLFLTSWERDLMPEGILRTIPKTAWRPEDQKRLSSQP